MAWTAPRTWVASETVTATNMNLHIKDNLNAIAPLGVGPVYTTWAPTLTNLTAGNGTTTARYTQLGKTVHGLLIFTLGSTSSVGTAPQFSLPVTMASSWGTVAPIGQAMLLDSGTVIYYGTCRPVSTTAAVMYVGVASGSYLSDGVISSTVPHTWTTSDALAVSFTYEAA